MRDHLIVEFADAAEDRAERTARTMSVVVGAGYTGTEVTVQGQLLTADTRPAPITPLAAAGHR